MGQTDMFVTGLVRLAGKPFGWDKQGPLIISRGVVKEVQGVQLHRATNFTGATS